MLMQPVSARCMRSCVPCCGPGWAPTARRLHQVFWAAAPVPLMSSACMTSVTSTLSGKCHIFLSALLCKLCGTNMVHCLLMVFPCIQPPGDASSVASSGAPRKEGGKYYILFQPPKADCMGCHPTKGSTKHTKQSLHGTIGA